MLSEAQGRVTLGLEIVSQELAALPVQEWASFRHSRCTLLDLQTLDCLVWGPWGTSHVLRGLECPYPGHSLLALQLCPPLPHLSEVSLILLAWPFLPLKVPGKVCGDEMEAVGAAGGGGGAVGETVSALFTTPHFLPLSGFSNYCCFCFPLPPLPLCPFFLSFSSLLRLFLPSSPLSVRLALPISPSWPPAPP